jgi:hypothetical protein
MIRRSYRRSIFLLSFLGCLLFSCNQKNTESPATVFQVLDSKYTGLDFTNALTPTDSFNMFNYMYFYNGAGVGAGDFNNDGLIDLFFASNQGQNELYLNTGNLTFKDVTAAAKIPDDRAWSTGVSVVDINNDGLLDIYVCRVGNFETQKGHNQFLICKGIDKSGVPFYSDESHDLGLDFSGFSTQAAFLDYDLDGDLDMYLMNHGIRSIGTFGERSSFLGTYDSYSGDRLYRNDLNSLSLGEGKGGAFTDVTKSCGINSSSIGYGLGVCVSDINLDGWPDLYIGNDFQENDYLYINQKNGTFKDELTESMMHTSQFSMGVDVADINNDAFPEIISMDMLPSDPYILKRSLGEDQYDIFMMKLGYGYWPQYAANNVQLNLRNGHFSEIAKYAGVHATDWSWSSLWLDFDNDGWKDLFVSNGIPKRLNDIDYINFVSNEKLSEKIRTGTMSSTDMSIIDQFPEIKLPNKFYHNKRDASFGDIGNAIAGDIPTFSNGAVYADLDNDGDLDIVVNNIKDHALIYQNKTNEKTVNDYLQLELEGPQENINAIGARVILYSGGDIETYEKYPVRGFLSSMEIPLHLGLNEVRVDSMKLIWPDNSWQPVSYSGDKHLVKVVYKKGLPLFDFSTLRNHYHNSTAPAEDITTASGLNYVHRENNFGEFDREPLMPHMVSQEGPALAVDDINGDGMQDVFVGSARGGKSVIYLQNREGHFIQSVQQALDADSNYEDVSACFADVNNDGWKDLLVGSGGNEYYGTDSFNTPRLYLNNGKGNFVKLQNAFKGIYITASVITAYDFNQDGFTDVFIGARAVPFDYGKTPTSYLMQNDGKGYFRDVTKTYNASLANSGFVTNAIWFDIDKDGDKDLLACYEWEGIYAYINQKTKFEKTTITDKKGWWNFILPVDTDNDGDYDVIAGNLGLNNRLIASEQQPVRLYFEDFDGNGKKEQVISYYLNGREIPLANKAELEKQMPGLKKQFLYADDFAKASLKEMFTEEKLNNATTLSANYFANALLVNNGKGRFTLNALPWQAQLTCMKNAVVINANKDGLPDILLGGNYYANNMQLGRFDADYGTILVNKGSNLFTCEKVNGVVLKGQVRRMEKIKIGNTDAIIMARNNDSLKVIRWK